jgi:hypothetical protein
MATIDAKVQLTLNLYEVKLLRDLLGISCKTNEEIDSFLKSLSEGDKETIKDMFDVLVYVGYGRINK